MKKLVLVVVTLCILSSCANSSQERQGTNHVILTSEGVCDNGKKGLTTASMEFDIEGGKIKISVGISDVSDRRLLINKNIKITVEYKNKPSLGSIEQAYSDSLSSSDFSRYPKDYEMLAPVHARGEEVFPFVYKREIPVDDLDVLSSVEIDMRIRVIDLDNVNNEVGETHTFIVHP
jgi:hypothetical protein